MQEAAMEEHIGEKRQILDHARVRIGIGAEVARRNQREALQEQLELARAQGDLEQEDPGVERDQPPGDDRRITGRHGDLNGQHGVASPPHPLQQQATHHALAQSVAGRIGQFAPVLHPAPGRQAAGQGYHLGQVLHTPDGAFRIIDFEGEPARPLEERREKHSALRDVAGMLRSFSYAAATCANTARAALGERDAVARAEQWERELREAFLRGYLPEAREHPHFLPQARARLDILLELFEMEKVFYELAYELNNRPGWAWIPLRGAERMLRAAL